MLLGRQRVACCTVLSCFLNTGRATAHFQALLGSFHVAINIQILQAHPAERTNGYIHRATNAGVVQGKLFEMSHVRNRQRHGSGQTSVVGQMQTSEKRQGTNLAGNRSMDSTVR